MMMVGWPIGLHLSCLIVLLYDADVLLFFDHWTLVNKNENKYNNGPGQSIVYALLFFFFFWME